MPLSEPVLFTNRRGYKLIGILETPDEKYRNDIAILILSPGIKMRVGPHRLYKKLSDRLIRAGFTVLRFDFYGLGDSEGEVEERELADVYNSIQDGRYVEDTIDAIDWMQQHHGFNRFLLSGLCGGAITGLLAGCDDDRVEGLLALGLINVFEGGDKNFSHYITDGQLEQLAPGYFDKLGDLESWKRLLLFKSDIRAILKIIFLPLKKIFVKAKSSVAVITDNPVPVNLDSKQNSNVNPKFAPAFFKMLQNRKKMLLVYSGQDRLIHEYQEKFEKIYHTQLMSYSDLYQLRIIDDANHIMSKPEWEERLYEYIFEWLFNEFGPGFVLQQESNLDMPKQGTINP